MEINHRLRLKDCKRIVVKVGTSTLTHENGKMNFTRMDRLAMTLSELMNEEKEVILVSSGSIGVGMGKFNLKKRPEGMGMKQALAAIGQCELMNIYSRLFATYNQMVGQMLLTKPDINDEIRKENVLNTFNHLLDLGVIPIVNENDTVSVDEIKSLMMFGDNDTLSAVVTRLVKADLLIILSDIDGLYDSNPRENNESHLISVVEDIDDSIRNCAGEAGTRRGTGGMVTKLDAAEIVTNAGADMVIANGSDPAIIQRILNGEELGTLFVRKSQKNLINS
ncbi:MAG TPA: glutamate 5-kinase [Clostridiaceae bacterium]|jgi:glutamate 5-kinase|nr:glutamate 5-kinase [Clostridiaceae bacterium]